MKIATVKKSVSPILDVADFMAYGCEQLGHSVTKIDWSGRSSDSILGELSGFDLAFIPIAEVSRPLHRPLGEFSTREFIEGLNNLPCKVVLDINDEPRIHSRLERVIFPYYRRMVWPGTQKYLDKWSNCERVIQELIVGEHYCYAPRALAKERDVVFNGSLYAFRVDFVRALLERLGNGVNFKICSKKVPEIDSRFLIGNGEKLILHEELNQIYNETKVLLLFGMYADNIDQYSEGQLKDIDGQPERSAGHACRIFSYLGSGGFTLVDRRMENDRYFREGVEAASYNSVDECAEKIRYYLEHNDEREAIAKAGNERYLKDHTIEIRMKRVLEAVMADR